MKTLNVAIIGTKFMGKAHSNAWANAPRFFEMGIRPVLKVAVGTNAAGAQQLADTWGWEEASTDWRAVVARPDIDIVDIATPTYLHADMAVAAAEAGKHVFLEKPFALSVEQAERMVAAVERANVVHYVNHNYRRAPAVRLAKRLIDDGFIGRIFHWRSAYLQDWIVDPSFPLTWHLRRETAGYGAHGDLGSHSVDLARYLIGEVAAVTDGQDFFATIDEFREFARAGAAAWQNQGHAGLYRAIHTFKGSFNQFGFYHLPAALHEVEAELQALLAATGGSPEIEDAANSLVFATGWMALLDRDLATINETLGEDFLLSLIHISEPTRPY